MCGWIAHIEKFKFDSHPWADSRTMCEYCSSTERPTSPIWSMSGSKHNEKQHSARTFDVIVFFELHRTKTALDAGAYH